MTNADLVGAAEDDEDGADDPGGILEVGTSGPHVLGQPELHLSTAGQTAVVLTLVSETDTLALLHCIRGYTSYLAGCPWLHVSMVTCLTWPGYPWLHALPSRVSTATCSTWPGCP